MCCAAPEHSGLRYDQILGCSYRVYAPPGNQSIPGNYNFYNIHNNLRHGLAKGDVVILYVGKAANNQARQGF
jgi:hypothetical protein